MSSSTAVECRCEFTWGYYENFKKAEDATIAFKQALKKAKTYATEQGFNTPLFSFEGCQNHLASEKIFLGVPVTFKYTAINPEGVSKEMKKDFGLIEMVDDIRKGFNFTHLPEEKILEELKKKIDKVS